MTNPLVIRSATLNDIPIIGQLATEIWPEAYGEILTPGQLAYMVDFIYSPVSLEKQMSVHNHRFLVAELNDEPIGFASYSKHNNADTYKLHKLYVKAGNQGAGIGKALLNHVLETVTALHGVALILNVNRFNKARFFYEKLGFTIIASEDVDLGNNYFMNDFVMEKKLG